MYRNNFRNDVSSTFTIHRIQTEENVEESQWHNQEHPGRHCLPWANHMQEHSQTCSWLDAAHHHRQTRPRWPGLRFFDLTDIFLVFTFMLITVPLFYSTKLQTLLWTNQANSRWSLLQPMEAKARSGSVLISLVAAVEWACTTRMRSAIHILHFCTSIVSGSIKC